MGCPSTDNGFRNGDFSSREYVVYKTDQQRVKYIVQLGMAHASMTNSSVALMEPSYVNKTVANDEPTTNDDYENEVLKDTPLV